jgi:hypothetical protein
VTTSVDEAIAVWSSGGGRAFLDRLRESGQPWLLERTVAIYALANGGVPVLHGSGVLLGIGEECFLLSAGHVLIAAKAEDTVLLISPGLAGEDFIPLHGVEIQHTDNKDDIDIGFVRLPLEIRVALEPHKSFLRLCELDLSLGPEPDGWFAVVGFPRQLTSFDHPTNTITSDVFYYGTVRHQGTLDSYTPGYSFAVAFPPDSNVDPQGVLSRLPDLHGISGCGIWCMHRLGFPFKRPENWSIEDIRLTAIEHSVVDRKAIKGIRIRHVVVCIGDAYPHLRGPISLSMH